MSKSKLGHWFRFSLRSLLVFTLLAGLLMGWITKERMQSQREERIAGWLQEQKLTLLDGGNQLPHPSMAVAFGGPYESWELGPTNPPQSWWRSLARQVLGKRIIEVVAHQPAIKDLTPLAELTSLQRLVLPRNQISDFAPLTRLTKLQILDLSYTQIHDFSTVAGLTNLIYLDLSGTTVKDLAPLRGLTNLQYLHLDGTQVSDLESLPSLENLEYLTLRDTKVTDLTPLRELKNLRELHLNARDGLVATPVTREQIEALQKALPNCKIRHDL